MSLIKDFIRGLSESITHEVRDSIHCEISKYIDEAVEKSMRKMFVIGSAVSLIAIGSFLFLWGVASGITKIFNMGGLGFMIFGIFGVLIGILVYNRFNETNIKK